VPQIVVGGETFGWRVAARQDETSITVTLVVRPALVAVFHGHRVAFLFSGARQSLSITPSVVRRVIQAAQAQGWPGTRVRFDAAEVQFPEAVLPFDVPDLELQAACEQWFVPYPGRAALTEAAQAEGGDPARIAARFPGLTVAQITSWLARLGI
jgi:hypothetical protein